MTDYIESRYFGPALTNQQCIVIHSLECDAKPGIGRELATGWFRNPDNQTSVHSISDPRENVDTVRHSQRAWHCGTGNNRSTGREHAGRATWTAAQWRTPDVLNMLKISARDVARDCKEMGIPVRWLSVSQLQNGERGLCTHNDMRLAFGGTTHWDPGPNFPYAEFLSYVQAEYNKLVKPQPIPTPVGGKTYTVVSGDSLSKIAQKFGVTVAQLVSWNGIKDANSINVGQVLKVGPVVPPKPNPTPVPVPPKPGPGSFSITVSGKKVEIYNKAWPKPACPYVSPGALGVPTKTNTHINGDAGAVKVLRAWLASIGIVQATPAHVLSTIFTPGMRDAVKKGQEWINKAAGYERLKVTGIVDKKTWDAFPLRTKMTRAEMRAPGKR